MKLRIFNAKLLLIGGLSLAAQGSFAQDEKPEKVQRAEKAAKADKQDKEDDKEYDQKLQKLQGQMRDLQREMSKLRTEKFRRSAEELRKTSKELSAQTLARLDGNLNTAFNSMTFSTNSLKGLGSITRDVDGRSYSYSTDDDSKLKEQLQSGELKEKTKTYSKTYSAGADDKLSIKNTFGKISVNTWNKKEIKVEVQMKAYANEEEDAQKLLDKINIADSKEADQISFKTNIEPNSLSNGSRSFTFGTLFSDGKKRTNKVEVNYVVYMPAKTQLDLTNTYGNVTLPDGVGKVSVKVTYGGLVSKELTDPQIKIVYGDAKINTINNGNINVTYGDLKLGTADNLTARVAYGTMNVDKLRSSGNISATYGDGVTINELDKNCKAVNVRAQYTKVNLSTKFDYDFDVTTTLGSFDYDKNAVKVTTSTPAENSRHYSTTRNFKGQVNKGDADKLITVRSTYATVKIDQ